MGYLSWLFFCLTPFGFFCTKNGIGLIVGTVFLILGFVFKFAGNNIGGTPTATVKVEHQKFWEWHYKDRMRSTLTQKNSINDGLMALKDKEARAWATTICGYHNAWVPPETTQEQIARASGVITEKMIKERDEKKDRLQVGKYILMNELMEKYDTTRVSKGVRNLCYYSKTRIKKDLDKIKTSNNRYITEYWAYDKYKKSIKEIWNSLSEEEKNQAEKWVKEYEEKLIRTAGDSEIRNEFIIRSVKMDVNKDDSLILTRGQQIIDKINNVFMDIRNKYPLIIDEDLYSNGTIFYMNGNDGTDYDWNVEERCCEFYIYHSNKMPFIKLYVNKDDTYTAFVYPNVKNVEIDNFCNMETIRDNLREGDSLYLATILYNKADKENIYDADIRKIDFSYEPKEWEVLEMNYDYDENDEL